jgi:hypothetical protein
MSEWTTHLADQLDYHWRNQLRPRLDGLTDEEYFWQPVPNCWTVHPDGAIDFTFPPPHPAPFTTIAWRLAHVITLLSSDRNGTWLGLEPQPDAEVPPNAGTASDAIVDLQRSYTVFRRYLGLVPAASLSELMGPIAGPYADATRFGFVLHQLDEFVHHGAEIALLRDLYRASGRSSSL